MTEDTCEVHYDKEGDFLEVFFGEPTKCYTEEPQEGVFIRKDQETHEIKSIGILAFSKRVSLLQQITKQLNKKLPLNISIQ